MELVLIEWVDSSGSKSGWHWKSEFSKLKPLRIRSVGWVVEENDEVLWFAPHVEYDGDSGDLQMQGDMRIPKVAITSRKVLES